MLIEPSNVKSRKNDENVKGNRGCTVAWRREAPEKETNEACNGYMLRREGRVSEKHAKTEGKEWIEGLMEKQGEQVSRNFKGTYLVVIDEN